jgi:hypothetical protein
MMCRSGQIALLLRDHGDMSSSREYLQIGLRCIEETSVTEDKADDKGRATERLRCLAMQLNVKIVIMDKQNGIHPTCTLAIQ